MSKIDKMINLMGSSKRIRIFDTDGDKVPDIADCQPRNPRKQGLIDNIRAKIRVQRDAKRRVREGEFKSEKDIEEKTGGSLSRESALKEFRKRKIREVGREAEYEERLVVAKKKGRERARAPSFGQQFAAGFGSRPLVGGKRTTKKGKKGKRKILNRKPDFSRLFDGPKIDNDVLKGKIF